MKLTKSLAAALVLCLSPITVFASSFDIKDLLGKAAETLSDKNTLTDMIEGVFAKTNLTVADITGQWTSNAPAVSFQSENLLKKAGGVAAASTIESKIAPYYQKYGLDGAVLTVNEDGTFSLKLKKLTLTGTVEATGKSSEANFIFNFKAFGAISMGYVNAYVSKSGSAMDVMFDASKLKTILSTAATLSKMKLAQTASSMLSAYDGICIGFKFKQTGAAATSAQQSTSGSLLPQGILTPSTQTSDSTAVNPSLQLLKGLLGGSKK